VAKLPYSQMNVPAPPAGLEPAASGLRARRHRRFDHGGKPPSADTPAAGLEPALSRVTVARLTVSTTPERQTEAEGGGVEPPGLRGPPVFETGYRAGGSPSEGGPGRRRTCTVPGKSRKLCRVELRSRDVTGRARTCAAPRFRRALYRTELRSHEIGGAGLEPAPSSVSERRSTR